MAPKGNKFYLLRSKHGRDPLFADAELLREAAYEYFAWIDRTPWKRNEAIKSGDRAGTIIKVPTARPYTLSGLCIYLGADESFWRNFRAQQKDNEGFSAVIRHIEAIIRTQKFEGAAVGVFNANIISRDLGLVDKQQMNIDLDAADDDTIEKLYEKVMQGVKQ